jgi:acetylornithine deacetylase/succinyl-diaminopimelate desuccinylase-like protein
VTTLDSNAVLSRVSAAEEEQIDALKEYLRIPSVSTDPSYDEDVRRCAEFLAGAMRKSGLEAEVIETAGHPLVYAERCNQPGLPTVLFYGHYDVQPPEPLEEWRHPPFEPTIEEGRLVARGATDDKGQSFAHLMAVARILEERVELPVNVKFLIEGEEESGGEAIETYVRGAGRERIACDCVVVSDSSMFAPGIPSILYGLKGLLYVEIRVFGPNRDLHSGSFGGAVRNPANALCDLLAALRDEETGTVRIPGFYDDVRPLEPWEREEFSRLPYDEGAYKAELGLSDLWGEQGFTTFERTWARPTLDINGIWGGYQGPGAKTIIPASASAKVSMRLVPDQDPSKIADALRRHLEDACPSGTRIEVEVHSQAPAVLVDTQGTAAEAAMAALEEVWGTPPVRVREGGSIPIVGTFAEVLEVPVLLIGFGLADDRLHSPNEKFDLHSYLQGIRTTVCFLDRLGATTS